ncbi:hypothetical protein RZO55_01800 [Clostridium boliviensis]|uniref:Uncharacterized protein n=1 Tax=Clostridium boliviensis TaxID=318465 RepID=A0ABU4GFC3_9CLOT|nr:hypothetical protein [Clostridium boliviensis]MDW2796323.1 hypothetical protein [Clostridium boliviensis]
MLRKRFGFISFVIVLAVFFAVGCGKKGDPAAGLKTTKMTESETAASIMENALSEEDITEQGITEDSSESTDMADDQTAEGPGKQAEAFAEKIQEAVSDRSLETLAELITYPCVFITGDQEKIILKTQEDLLKQNPDMVFGDDLMVAVAKVDTAMLKKTAEGVAMGEGDSRIVFQESPEGSIGITEIKE